MVLFLLPSRPHPRESDMDPSDKALEAPGQDAASAAVTGPAAQTS
jgi:hypothetical protein